MTRALLARRLPLLLAAALAAPAQAADPEAAPFAIEEVDFTPDCRPNAALYRLFSLFVPGLRTASGGPEPVPDKLLSDAVSGEASLVLWLDNAVRWHGLHLVGVRYQHGIERGPVNYALVFTDSPARVRAVWNERGWRLPPPGETRDVAGLENYVSIGVQSDEEHATVTCFRD